MIQFIFNYGIEYFLIFLIFVTGIWTLFGVQSVFVKTIIIFGLLGIYFIWAVWHHLNDEKKVNFNVIMEYIAVIMLVGWILFSVIS